MSSNSGQFNCPNKGDIIINPKTSRPVKVGSRTWLLLVKEGLLQGHYKDEKKLVEQPNDYDETEEVIYKANKTLKNHGKQAVRGRGIYKGSIVSRNLKPKTEEVQKHTAKCASKVMKKFTSKNEELTTNLLELDDEELEKELERLILQEIANTSTASTNVKTNKMNKMKKKNVVERYEEQEQEEATEEEDELDDDDDEFYKQ